jgi:hypothetical protein
LSFAVFMILFIKATSQLTYWVIFYLFFIIIL